MDLFSPIAAAGKHRDQHISTDTLVEFDSATINKTLKTGLSEDCYGEKMTNILQLEESNYHYRRRHFEPSDALPP